MTAEDQRLKDGDNSQPSWRLWGPYISERQWGTVREDYSASGDAWTYSNHDQARSRAYRWGEDGLAGICDAEQRLCFAVALWNGRDPILKERLFGLSNAQGNHGEDVKEYYYYLDATPSHSYLKMLYKYPQSEYPYARLVEENARRGLQNNEYELIDTGIFDGNRYWDVFVEYFKAAPDDILTQISIYNRSPDVATIHVLPQLWFRNTWSWGETGQKPSLVVQADGSILAQHASLGAYQLYAKPEHELLFCENETNTQRLWGVRAGGYFKDAVHEYVVHGNRGAVNPQRRGTKAAVHYVLQVAGEGTEEIRLRLCAHRQSRPFANFDELAAARVREANEYYVRLQRNQPNQDARLVQRQAFAGMIWSKQFYNYDVRTWLKGDPGQPPPPAGHTNQRNADWTHFNGSNILSMPDKWEYPWFAAWDLAFHAVTIALIDADFAKQQLLQLGEPRYMHPNGQLPAYEWKFDDANPPIQAWAAWRVFQIDRKQRRQTNPRDPGDLDFLKRIIQKQLLTFTFWANRKDAGGRNLFQGGFLGLDNIGVFDRSKPLPTGGTISQADGTSWMAMFALNLLRISLELAVHDQVYEDLAIKFFEHFLYIAHAITNIGNQGIGLWNEEDGFYYSVLNLPDGQMVPLKIRSMVGLTPLFAVETLEASTLAKLPVFSQQMDWFLNHRPDLTGLVSHWNVPGVGERQLLSLLRGHRMKAVLKRMLDPEEFLSGYGVRAVSRYHQAHPYTYWVDGHELRVDYEPSESRSRLFGGNSNWRGPIWFPVNFLIIESLEKFHHYYGDDFKIECPTGSGHYLTIDQVAEELVNRLAGIFLKNPAGERPVYALYPKLQQDQEFRDYINFHEYFDGDTGRGVGASHQTGWTGLIAKLLQSRAGYTIRGCQEVPGELQEVGGMNIYGSKAHVVIVGGGFAGLTCARKLAKSGDVRVTLIDRNNYHQFQPLLYQLATAELGTPDVATSLRQSLRGHANVDVKMQQVTTVNPDTRTVTTREGESYQGDFLVLAAGSQANFFGTTGAKENAYPLYSLEEAQRLRSRILAVFEEADRDPRLVEQGALNFVVVGGGATGTEIAGALADMINLTMPSEYGDLALNHARVYLVDHGHALLNPFPVKAHDYAARVLQQKGVQLRMGIGVKEVAPDHVLLSDGTSIQTRTVIWAGGLMASPLAANTGLPRGHGGRIEVRPDLTVEGFPGVYALGDFANIPDPDGQSLPQLGSVAQQCGEWTAKNILAEIAGETRTPFHYHDKGIMAMIGRNSAVAAVGKKRHELDGPIAFAAWLGVHALLMAGIRERIEAFIDWAWNYFGRSRPIQVLDRIDEGRIAWDESTEGGSPVASPAVKTAR